MTTNNTSMLADLARSGLTAGHAKTLKLNLLTAAQTHARVGFNCSPAYEIPYHGLDGEDLGFSRFRFINPMPGMPRYYQDAGTLPRLYLPAVLKGGWRGIAADPSIPLRITEGEKKAAAACVAGLPTVGLGGVWTWRSKKKKDGETLAIADLDLFTWTARTVLLIFDSDIGENLGVQLALRALATELIGRGARPALVKLPPGADGKTGLDDFLLQESVAALAVLESEAEPVLGRLADALWRLNDELVYVQEQSTVLQLPLMKFVSAANLISTTHADRSVEIVGIDGVTKKISIAREWLKWPCRRTARALAYEPGEPADLPDGRLNRWPGWGTQPVLGDISPWTKLLAYLFAGDKPARTWFEQWCAYPLQHPGAKMYTAVVLFSLAHGVGKSLVGMTLGKIYGTNFVLLSQEDLQSSFNAWAAARQFALADEITGTEKRRDADRIKNLITRDLVTINAKFQPPYTLPDRLNYLFTTNHPDAFVIERLDRRFFVHETPTAPLSDTFYQHYDTWLHADGPACLFHHLLRLNLTGFQAKTQAPESEAKTDMAETSMSDVDLLVADLMSNADTALISDGQPLLSIRDLYTIEELFSFFEAVNHVKFLTRGQLGKSLRRGGFRGLPVTRTPLGLKRLWAVRNEGKWTAATHSQRSDEYMRGRPATLTLIEGGKKAAKF